MFLQSNKLRFLAIAVLASLVCFDVVDAKKPSGGGGSRRTSYTIVKLDDGNGTWECSARDVNNLRDVVGQVVDTVTSERWAAYWEVSGSGVSIESRVIALAGGRRADSINDHGEIVGYGTASNGPDVALYWANANETPLVLPPLNEGVHTGALAINNDGVVCGFSGGQAVAWRVNWVDGQPSTWGPLALPTLDDSWTSAISNNDEEGSAQIVGVFRIPPRLGEPTAAVAWTVQSLPDGTLAVDSLPHIVQTGDASALGVNDGGSICGEVGWPPEAMVWTGVAAQTLYRAPDLSQASAQDINNNGVIVGWGDTGQIAREAVVWPSADAKMIRLNSYLGRRSPFVKLVEACTVNELGEVVGTGFTGVGGSPDAAFLAIPD